MNFSLMVILHYYWHRPYGSAPEAVQAVYAEAGDVPRVLYLLRGLVVLYLGLQAEHLLHVGRGDIPSDHDML